MASHPIVHVDFPAKDPATAAKFYEAAFGWRLQHDETFDYWMFTAEGGPGGGFVSTAANPTGGAVRAEIGKPLIYLGSEDIEADLGRVEGAGGRVLLGRTEIPKTGWYAIFADPSGNVLGFYQGMHTSS